MKKSKEKTKVPKKIKVSPTPNLLESSRPNQNTPIIPNSSELKLKDDLGLFIGSKKYYETPEQLDIKVTEYFDKCEQEKRPATIPGLARHVGFNSRTALWNYEHKESHKAFHEVLERAKNRFHEQLEEILLNGKNNPAGAIFLGKNYGYVDKIEIDTKGQYITQMIPVPAEEPQPKTINIDESSKEGI